MTVNQKICVISFDHWNYDEHIVLALQKRGIVANHIKIGDFKHKNILERLKNSFSKIFFGKNPKIKKRQDFIITQLEKFGKQDQILVINPELIAASYHLEIKKHTKKYIAYLYDSMDRCPINHLLNGFFDEIFSFDNDDILKYNFKKTTNYIYLKKQEIAHNKTNLDLFYLASYDNRIAFLKQIAQQLDALNLKYQFVIVGKKVWLKMFFSVFKSKKTGIKYQISRVTQKDLIEKYAKTTCIIDLVRENQTGLSFRVFEALALNKKIITNNQSIKTYDFYNPTNIFVIDSDILSIDKDFFVKPYTALPNQIYNKYTIDSWIENVFNLQ